MAVYRIDGCQWNCYPGTTVLINKLGIKDQSELDAVEKQITLLRGIQAEQQTEFRNVDLDFYKRLHSLLFGDIYDWAGCLRTINISKKGTVFCDHSQLEKVGTKKFERLEKLDFLCGMPEERFFDELAELCHDMNMLHPFREGNGRTLRLFITLLVRNTGRDIDFAKCGSDIMMIAAVKAAEGDISVLRTVLSDIIT
ncbi:MAG: Fic family protein [Ruminococcus sp.]|uniref:Fic/DOC family protein n=1 Tax=Ruminococcus sp. TaxID=41978 RepID=UPI001B20DCF4|nr:Fic family protein [Ruminococcus sp.]MBO7473145.1 Fic family protein [Ruminococcus sp.]